jgi:hypothetical protein
MGDVEQTERADGRVELAAGWALSDPRLFTSALFYGVWMRRPPAVRAA